MLFSPDLASAPVSFPVLPADGSLEPAAPSAVPLEPALWNERHREYLLNVALGKTRNSATAEDLVQDTFLAAWKARHHFEGKSSERTWLTRILLNKIADSYRSAGRKPSVAISQITAPDQSGDDLFDVLHRSRPGHDGSHDAEPSAAAERAEFIRLLEHCLENIPSHAARAYRMRELQGLSTEEIAEALEITPNHLWVLIHRAKKALRAQLENQWESALEGPVPATAVF